MASTSRVDKVVKATKLLQQLKAELQVLQDTSMRSELSTATNAKALAAALEVQLEAMYLDAKVIEGGLS